MKSSFLSVFESILHAAEAALQIAAPIIAVLYPLEGALLIQAVNAAIGAEALMNKPGMGAEKAALVKAQTQATVDVANSILVKQGKPKLRENLTDVIQQQVQVVVAGLNTVQQAVEAAPVAEVAKI